MKVCFFGYGLQDIGGGSSQYFTVLAKEMNRQGHEVTMVSSGKRRNDLSSAISFVSIAAGNSYIEKYLLSPMRFLLYFLRQNEFDLIHAASSYPRFAYLCKMISYTSGIPVVYSVLSEKSLPHNMAFDAVIYTSKRLAVKYGSPEYYIPTFIQFEKSISSLKYDFGRNNGFVVGTLGTPLKRRGHMVLLKSIPLVIERYPDAQFVFAVAIHPQITRKQERAGLEAIKKFVKENSLTNNVKIMGKVDVVRFLNSLDVLVYPLETTVGAFDITPTILECLGAGCCLITSKVGANDEVIRDGYNGLFVEKQDPKLYAEKIINLIENRSFHSRLKANSKKNLEEFDVRRVVPAVLNIYQQIRKLS